MPGSKTPIALFTYNRPRHTERALEALARCTRLDECKVRIYCDGPKAAHGTSAVEASRRVVDSWAEQLDAKVVKHAENLGLARSIVGGVTELCSLYGRVIVLEDDLVVRGDFLEFMLDALKWYEEATSVYQVSGYMFRIAPPIGPRALFLPMVTTWGWATWERAWRVFDWQATGAGELLEDPQLRSAFDLDDSYPYGDLLSQRLQGQNSSWGILWWYAVFRAGGLTLFPRRSLVWNGGFDGSGVHCADSGGFAQLSLEAFLRVGPGETVSFPRRIAVHSGAFRRVKRHLKSWSDRGAPSWSGRARRFLSLPERVLSRVRSLSSGR